ncbi:hypothetical protein CC86DRAFT_325470 [Ophiobolus disseminans]|uniref:Uncharacterized protein n=1 Tax=Ophiobolus disseminans TaxID=1469910 RepID=A0A6A6ZYK6_9PLEO|nr:hypothetical protein CC86DRAFT_325470 [Ophiobolus disseminans]
MRYTSAVVLSTLAVGQAAAAHNRHASFHARREASKRDADPVPVDWNAISYDLSAVDWSSVFASDKAAKPTAAPEQKKPEQKQPEPVVAKPTPTPEAKKESAPTPAASSPKPAESSKAAAPSVSKPDLKEKVENLVGDLMANVASISSAIDAKIGINDKANNGGLWVGKDSDWGMDVTNNGDDAVFYCWQKNGFAGMSINVNAPAISVGIKSGQTVSISAAAGTSGACAPATMKTPKSNFGGVKNTWAEFTFGDAGRKIMGVFNVSKNVNMKGCDISMKGATCTSDKATCIFQCQDENAESCEFGYNLVNCSASNGGGGGYDPIMGGVGGGCNMPESGERIKVSFA